MHRKGIFTGTVLGLAVTLVACAPARYTPEELTRLGARESIGEVVKQSRGSFSLHAAGGERTFRTGEATEYLPADYRSQAGDRVRVVFREVLERSGRIKYEVLQLEALAIAAGNRQLPNPIVGRIVAIGAGSVGYARQIAVRYRDDAEPLPIYLPSEGLAVLRGEGAEEVFDWNRLIGSEVAVTAERVPIRRGNALIYVARTIVLRHPPAPPAP